MLDEPDAHLHASQQAIVLRQLIDAAESSGKQIIFTTHSPEILTQAPEECIRWIGRPTDGSESDCGVDIETLLCSLGVQYWAAARNEAVPDIIVYVEGKTDRPIIQAVVNHCRKHSSKPLPSTVVIPHKSGRFDSTAVEALQRLASQVKPQTRVVGIRDLDWFYGDLEDTKEQVRSGTSWACLTLPCKEIENLLFDPELLFEMYARNVPLEELKQIVDTSSRDPRLVDEWRFNVRARIRERRPNHEDDSTKERRSDEIFNDWASDAELRRRLVAGKELHKLVRLAVSDKFQRSRNSPHAIESLPELPACLARIGEVIFGH